MNPQVAWERFVGVLMDLDGVITPTARIHRRAWGRLFEAYDFTDQDYLDLVDGRPRLDGVHAFLAARGVVLPTGEPDDPPGSPTLWGQGRLKDRIFLDLLDEDGVEAYPGTLAVLDHCEDHEIPVAVVSSSRNARRVLTAAAILDRFVLVVDGITSDDENLAGKPEPDQFLYAAALLGASPRGLVVVEDAVAGVTAARRGHFGLVVGVDRTGQRAALVAAGADTVVEDLAETLGPETTSSEPSRP